jgi:hypothetical protein
MTTPDLTDDDRADLARFLRAAIEADRSGARALSGRRGQVQRQHGPEDPQGAAIELRAGIPVEFQL